MDQNEDWEPESDIRPSGILLGVDTADDMAPAGVLERRQQVDAFLNAPDPFEKTDEPVGHTPLPGLEMPALAPSQWTRQQCEWMEFYEQMEPSLRSVLVRRTPETFQLLKWQAGLVGKKSMPLVIYLTLAKISFSVNVVAFTTVGEFRVFVLPSEAAEIQMEMGAPLTFKYDGKTTDAIFVSCYRLDGFPYKFLQLGVDQSARKE